MAGLTRVAFVFLLVCSPFVVTVVNADKATSDAIYNELQKLAQNKWRYPDYLQILTLLQTFRKSFRSQCPPAFRRT